MVNPTSLAVQQIHHQQWLEDIRACNERPASMTVGEWCRQHGINRHTYYWRMKVLRKACLDEIQDSEGKRVATAEIAASFVELPQPVTAPESCGQVMLRIGSASLEIPETISDSFLRRILEAASHA